MSYKLTADGAAVVDPDTHWRKIDSSTPRGAKVQLINKASGVAQYGRHSPSDTFFTHWHPLPIFDKDEK